MNVFRRIANGDYKLFGMVLLEDENSVEVDAIMRHHRGSDEEEITRAIIKKWITNGGAQCTYAHLLYSLREADLGGLASELTASISEGEIIMVVILS